jgi:MFS family permease
MSTAPARSLTSPLNLSKFTFFLIFAAAAAVLPFLTLYYESLGLSGRQIGMLAGLPPLVMLFTASIWSGLADATQRHKLVMAVAMLGLAGSGLLFLLVDSFWALVPVVILYAFCFGPVEPLLSNTALELLRGRTEQYGKVRLWGAFTAAAAAELEAPVLDVLRGLHRCLAVLSVHRRPVDAHSIPPVPVLRDP